jgi:hypothetical protein
MEIRTMRPTPVPVAARGRTRLILTLLLLVPVVGCTTTRTVTIVAKPEDAMIKIDGVDYGRGPVTESFVFKDPSKVYQIEANRTGYKMRSDQITRDDDRKIIELELPVQSREIYFVVEPVDAIIKINGKQVTPRPVKTHSQTLQFTVDNRNNWTNYTVTAERENFQPATVNVSWPDNTQYYTLRLEPMRKDLSIRSDPSGATVYFDGEKIGTTPLVDPGRAFPVDVGTGQFEQHTLRLEKPGYDPVEIPIGWEEGKSDYEVNLAVKRKEVRITTDPPDADVQIEGAKGERRGAVKVFQLEFPPIDEESGELKKYSATATKKAEPDREWQPQNFSIAWDNGRDAYHVQLKEVLTRPVPLTVATMRRAENGAWECVPRQVETLATRRVAEESGREQPAPLTRPGAGQSIGSMAMAPDGSRILFTVLTGKDRGDFRSQMRAVHADGASTDMLTDGRTLDLMPWFTPDGSQILFSSNRAGQRMQIWSMSAAGAPVVTRLSSTQTHDLWPCVDADPKPRLFYQAMVDTRDDPQVFMTPLGTMLQRELSRLGGTQPRIGPKNDALLFAVENPETGKRDIYRMNDNGEQVQNLTNTPQFDECDAVWSRDGRMIAYASDRGVDADGRNNYDIWVLDLAKPDEPVQVTANGSLDDNPLFDPRGNGIYFRSNRGGEWGIWRVTLR